MKIYQAKVREGYWHDISEAKYEFYEDSPELGVVVRVLYTESQEPVSSVQVSETTEEALHDKMVELSLSSLPNYKDVK